MQNLRKQRGMATILLVLLIGISVMLLTASVAKGLIGKKDASVAAHAQTNAQLMGWAGVSAFREYLLAQGKLDLQRIRALQGQNLTLRNEVNKKEIIAKNIQVHGCVTAGEPCSIAADISSDNKTAKAATTIQAVYEFNFKTGTAVAEKVALSFTGNTSFSGTTIRAEIPNSTVTMNIDGNAALLSGITFENISELTINATGDVLIDCSTQTCSNTKINVYAQGRVDLLNGGNYGVVKALGVVSLSAAKPTKTNVEQIYSTSDVLLSGDSTAQQIQAVGDVLLTAGASGGQIIANGSINLSASKATSLQSRKNIQIALSTVSGDVKAYETVEISVQSSIGGSVYAKGNKTLSAGLPLKAVAVTHSDSKVSGHIYASPSILFYGLGSVTGNAYVTQSVNGARSVVKGEILQQNSITALNFSITAVNTAQLQQEIAAQMDFETKVDVLAYKADANYIFTQNNQMSHVYLNHLYNQANGKTYMYENGQQYEVNSTGVKTVLNQQGFAIANYTYNGTKYIGALCLKVKDGSCDSEIIGFLPRLGVGTTLGINNDYDIAHTAPRKTWILRSTSSPSILDNAVFAPGILYFEGDVAMSGYGNGNADSMSNAFTNTILAEGDIRTESVSPRIYSPYNLLRAGTDKASLICNRRLKDVRNTPITTVSQTTPNSVSTQYLVPTNLCKDADTFSYNMNRAADDSKLQVEIDGKLVDKLDLGYVALMSNKNIAIGTCAQIYGDVYARSTIAGSASCGITGNKNAIVGSMASQGEAPYISGAKYMNTFSANSNIVVPNPAFTNAQEGTAGNEASKTDQVILKWSKYK
jgi:predicted acyltransferase (DUF342 family)